MERCQDANFVIEGGPPRGIRVGLASGHVKFRRLLSAFRLLNTIKMLYTDKKSDTATECLILNGSSSIRQKEAVHPRQDCAFVPAMQTLRCTPQQVFRL